jgi:hypothetical protein
LNVNQTFTYHGPHGTQTERYGRLREAGKALASLILETVPLSREQSIALTNVQQAVMWANAGIAINEAE